MNAHKQQLDTFFKKYEDRMEKALSEEHEIDVKATAAAFADFFVEASPVGVSGGKNDSEFHKRIPQGFELYRSIGTKAMKISSKEITPLDEFHSMVKVHWKTDYEKKDGTKDHIEFDVIYFLQTMKDESKIFAYITGDEEKVMQEHGLIPKK